MKLRILMATAAVGLVISGVAIAANSPTPAPAAATANSSMPAITPQPPSQVASTTVTTTTTTAPVTAMSMQNSKTIADLTNSNSDFSTLASALKSTGLDQTLASKGSFTVFAPTNAAFAKLGPAKLNDLMKPENKAELTQILTYHVVPQPLPAQANAQSTSLPTAEGQSLSVTRKPAGYQVQNAKSLGAPMAASNGSIIAIDSVLMPEAQAKMGTASTPAPANAMSSAAPANPNAALPSVSPTPTSLTKSTTIQTTTTTTSAPAAPAAMAK